MKNTPNADKMIDEAMWNAAFPLKERLSPSPQIVYVPVTESAAVPLMPDGLAVMRRIVSNHQAEKINGVMVDAFTASAFVKVYDAVDARKQEKLLSIPLGKAVEVVWKAFK